MAVCRMIAWAPYWGLANVGLSCLAVTYPVSSLLDLLRIIRPVLCGGYRALQVTRWSPPGRPPFFRRETLAVYSRSGCPDPHLTGTGYHEPVSDPEPQGTNVRVTLDPCVGEPEDDRAYERMGFKHGYVSRCAIALPVVRTRSVAHGGAWNNEPALPIIYRLLRGLS